MSERIMVIVCEDCGWRYWAGEHEQPESDTWTPLYRFRTHDCDPQHTHDR